MRGQVICPQGPSHPAGAESMLPALFIVRPPVPICLACSRHSMTNSLITELHGFLLALSPIVDPVF